MEQKNTTGSPNMVAGGGGGGEGWGEGTVRGLGMDAYTLLYLKWITNKDLFYKTGKYPNTK